MFFLGEYDKELKYITAIELYWLRQHKCESLRVEIDFHLQYGLLDSYFKAC